VSHFEGVLQVCTRKAFEALHIALEVIPGWVERLN
jgi:hypothetical protein